MGDKDEKSFLQRRGGRRISIPSSPISPTLSKRSDRFMRSPEIPTTFDTSSGTATPLENPIVDPVLPSTNIDHFGQTSSGSGDGGSRFKIIQAPVAEETDKRPSMERPEHARGITMAGRLSTSRPTQPSRPTYISDMASRSSPIIGRTPEAHDRHYDSSVSTSRNYSTTSLTTDRSIIDENTPAKATTTKKSRLNMLNPMSLLARRRSSQNAKLEDMNVNISPLQVPAIPDNFDPSIRGSFVHDFSSPRSKKSHFDNSPRREPFSSPANMRRPSDFGTPMKPFGSSPSPALHSPLFKEHFQDDDNSLQPGQTAYLHNVTNSHKLFDAPSPASLPSFAQKLPVTLPDPSVSTEAKKLPQLVIPDRDDSPPPPPPPPKRTPSPHLDLPAALPKHMTSVSSRFSFQIPEHESSTQEKLLEQRHKEHFSKDADKVDNTVANDEENDYDDYDFDADDGFEEKIPGVNTDYYEDDDFLNDDMPVKDIDFQSGQHVTTVNRQSLLGFHFTPNSTTFSPISPNNLSAPTPTDNDGFPIGIADTKYSPANVAPHRGLPEATDDKNPSLFFEGLRISTFDQNLIPQPESTPPLDDYSHQNFDDADLYFDDGEFDAEHDESGSHFDENLLEDGSSQIRDIPAENAKRYEAALERSGSNGRIAVVDPYSSGISRDTSSSSNFVDLRGGDSSGFSVSREHEPTHGLSSHTSVLTEDNLAAYHDALAEAANFAAASGKFNRQVSFKSDLSGDSDQFQSYNTQPKPAEYSLHSKDEATSEQLDDYNTFQFDDDGMDEYDLMIAEANAEALENDDDGFYGQEFGFYARTHSKDNSEQVNGGFFAARGSNGIKRSHSGKANFQEPSLTPITERSEWSTRNSVASFGHHSGIPNTQQSLPSPDISTLMKSLDSPSWDDDMSLSALMKLRRGAFGGSSTSINSLGERSMPGSSPLAHVSSYTFPPIPPAEKGYNARQNIGTSTSIVESEEEDDADMEQLTLTQNTPRKRMPGLSPTTTHSQTTNSAVSESPTLSRRSHHRRSSSGADSVSYLRDRDGHWVLERRRTGDDGEEELVEREYLVGGI